MRALCVVLFGLLLGGCWSDSVRVGSKDTVESRILAEMFAILLEEEGVAVERHPDLGGTAVVFHALTSGTIDLYPEYTGTGLALLGSPRSEAETDSFTLAARVFAENGLVLLDPLGFESGYVVLVRPDLARDHGLATISDLARVDDRLRFGVTESFAERPRDGLEPFLDRFGLSFAATEIFPRNDQDELYDSLVDGLVDVVMGVTTDPEIADYDLFALADDPHFFPVYEAAPLTSQAALLRVPEVADVMARLAGRIDDEMMQDLNGAVRLYGRSINRVARQALFDLGLVTKPPRDRTPVLAIATAPTMAGTETAIDTLRAVRRALRGREVVYADSAAPLEAVSRQTARLALTPAVSAFVNNDGQVVRDNRFEAIAAVGSTVLHALSLAGNPMSPMDATTIATGPAGSATYRLGDAIAASRNGVTLVPLVEGSPQEASEALRDGRAEVALVFTTPGQAELDSLLSRSGDITLVDADGWWRGPAQLTLPVMRPAQINADVYSGLDQPVATLATQIVLFGPATPDGFALGRDGPASLFEEVRPLQSQSVVAINENLGPHSAVDPHLRRAPALTPQVTLHNEGINPHPDRALLMILILAFVVWAGWLLVRPEASVPQTRGDSGRRPDA